MRRRLLLLMTMFALACGPQEATPPSVAALGDQGPPGAAVAVSLTLQASSALSVTALSIETDNVDMLSDREPDEAARLAIDGSLALENGFGDVVASAAPGAYSVFLLTPSDRAPALHIDLRLAGVRIQIEATSLPAIRVRCPDPVDVGDGAALDITATLDLDALESLLTGALLPPPLGVTELLVTDATEPALVQAIVDTVVSSWTVTCGLR